MKQYKSAFLSFCFPIYCLYRVFNGKKYTSVDIASACTSYILSVIFYFIYAFKKGLIVWDIYSHTHYIDVFSLFINVVVSFLAGGITALYGLIKLLFDVL